MSLPRGARAAHRAHAPQPCRPCNGPTTWRRRTGLRSDLQMVLTQGHPGPACLFTTATTKVWRGDDLSCMFPPPPSPPCARVHHFIVPLRRAILALLRARLCARRTWLWTRARVARVPRLALHPRSAVWTHGSAALPVPSQASRAHLHTRTRARVTAGHAVAQARAARFLPSFNLAGRGAKQCLDSSTAMRRVLWF